MGKRVKEGKKLRSSAATESNSTKKGVTGLNRGGKRNSVPSDVVDWGGKRGEKAKGQSGRKLSEKIEAFTQRELRKSARNLQRTRVYQLVRLFGRREGYSSVRLVTGSEGVALSEEEGECRARCLHAVTWRFQHAA